MCHYSISWDKDVNHTNELIIKVQKDKTVKGVICDRRSFLVPRIIALKHGDISGSSFVSYIQCLFVSLPSLSTRFPSRLKMRFCYHVTVGLALISPPSNLFYVLNHFPFSSKSLTLLVITVQEKTQVSGMMEANKKVFSRETRNRMRMEKKEKVWQKFVVMMFIELEDVSNWNPETWGTDMYKLAWIVKNRAVSSRGRDEISNNFSTWGGDPEKRLTLLCLSCVLYGMETGGWKWQVAESSRIFSKKNYCVREQRWKITKLEILWQFLPSEWFKEKTFYVLTKVYVPARMQGLSRVL